LVRTVGGGEEVGRAIALSLCASTHGRYICPGDDGRAGRAGRVARRPRSCDMG